MNWGFHSFPNCAPGYKSGTGDSLIDCLLSASNAVVGVGYWERCYFSKDLIVYVGKDKLARVGVLLVYGEKLGAIRRPDPFYASIAKIIHSNKPVTLPAQRKPRPLLA